MQKLIKELVSEKMKFKMKSMFGMKKSPRTK